MEKKNTTENPENATPFGPERLYLPGESEPKETNMDERLLTVTITTRRRDREGDIVEPAGLEFDHYLKNPVVLWAHDLSSAPIGRVRDITLLDDRVDATVQFADTLMGREIHKLYAEKFLSAWSIGFIPLEWERLPDDEDGLPQAGFHISRAEVVELSAVPVPANPEALTHALAEGNLHLSERMLKSLSLTTSQKKTISQNSNDFSPTTGAERAVKDRGVRFTLTQATDAAGQVARQLMRRELARAVALARGELN